MLATLTRKLCPILSLTIITIGCGKKIGQEETTGQITPHQDISSAFVMRLDSKQSNIKNYSLIADAQFIVPDRLIVRSGSATGKIIEIAHDVNEFDNSDFYFKCVYIPAPNPSEMMLKKCVNYNDDDFGDVSNNTFTLYKNNVLQIKLSGASGELTVDAIYSMGWLYSRD
jgi:hypothetical protein